MTSFLEIKVPPELFLDIGGHLAFFDKKALALTSRKCYALLGSFKCPDRLSWMVYLCIPVKWNPTLVKPMLCSPPIWNRWFSPRKELQSFHKQSRAHLSQAVIMNELHGLDERMYKYCGSLQPRQDWTYDSHSLATLYSSRVSNKAYYWDGTLDVVFYEPLMNNYFHEKELPVSMLAYFYIEKLDEVAQKMIHYDSRSTKGPWHILHKRLDQRLKKLRYNELQGQQRLESAEVETLWDPEEEPDRWGDLEVDFDAVEVETEES